MSKKGPEVLIEVSLNAGRDRGHLIREAGPDGREIVEHVVSRTQRMADRLFHLELIDRDQHTAATALRDAFERARPKMGRASAVDPEATPGGLGGFGSDVSDDIAWAKYLRFMREVGQEHTAVLRAVVIDDGNPVEWGRARRYGGMKLLRRALNRLAKVTGVA